MEDWLKNKLTIKVAGKPFKPFDATVGTRIAEKVKAKGFQLPSDPKELKKMFGYGWWKFDPAAATALLEQNGFTKKDGKWFKPDGKPWQIKLLTSTNASHPNMIYAFPIADQWRKFGIDVQAVPMDNLNSIIANQNFDVVMQFPTVEILGSGPDIYRSLKSFHSRYVVPVGQPAIGGSFSRWSDKRMDQIIERLEKVGFAETEATKLAQDALKIVVEEQPGMAIGSIVGFPGWDEYYWTGFPGQENAYTVPHFHWPNFQFILPRLKPTGK
jgi:peptide/nickel transport system substrate-binding protein